MKKKIESNNTLNSKTARIIDSKDLNNDKKFYGPVLKEFDFSEF